MNIVHIASELAPIAKVGGLGDVVYGLCKALSMQGHTVRIILPKYDTLNYNLLTNLRVHTRDLWSFDGDRSYHNTVWTGEIDGLELLLIEPHHPEYFFGRGMIYGCPDDIDRFCYFSRTCCEFLFKSEIRPDVLHIHDWPTATVPVFLKDMYAGLGFPKTRIVLTLHNLEHQGKCLPGHLTRFGLQGGRYLSEEGFPDTNRPELLNLLSGGIAYCDAITTVSPSYKKEILTREGGFGLDKILNLHANKISGILNGIDTEFWNPSSDPRIESPFPRFPPLTEEILTEIQERKSQNKKALQKRLGLSISKAPLVASIGRLVTQKGPELIAETFRHALKNGCQCIILGSAPDPEIHTVFEKLRDSFADNPNGMILFGYNEDLAHKIYAASDLFVVPSLFEPCGLTQMIALRYGSIPVVRKTGGLADTVSETPETANGFLFEEPTREALCKTLDRAFHITAFDLEKKRALLRRAVEQDFGWGHSVNEYLEIYR